MGKGTIVSNNGLGRYLVTIHYERSQIESRLAEIDDQITLNNTWLGGEGSLKIAIAELDRNEALDAWNAAIAVYDPNSENASQQADLIESTGKAYAEAQATLDVLYIHRDKRLFQNKSLEKEKQFLLRVPGDGDYPLWSADLTEDWEPGTVVGLLEVPNTAVALPDIGTMIVPGNLLGNEKPAWNPTKDGILQHTGTADPNAIWRNTALAAAADKWNPGYRFGVLSNKNGNVCTVTLDPAQSRYGLNSTSFGEFFDVSINVEAELNDVPINYMDCDGQAFDDGDHVVVEFINRDWNQPRVIGFSDNPRPCGGWIESFGPAIYDMGDNDPAEWPDEWKLAGGNWSPFSDQVSTIRDMGEIDQLLDRDRWAGEQIATGGGDPSYIAKVDAYASADQHKILSVVPTVTASGLPVVGSGYNHTAGGLIIDEDNLGVFILPGDNEDIVFNGQVSTDFPIWPDWTDLEISVSITNPERESYSFSSAGAVNLVLYHNLSTFVDLAAGGQYPIATSVSFTTGIVYPQDLSYPNIDFSPFTWTYGEYPMNHATINGKSCFSNRHSSVEQLKPNAIAPQTRAAWVFDNQSAPHTFSYTPGIVPTIDIGRAPNFSGVYRVTRSEIRCELAILGIHVRAGWYPFRFTSGRSVISLRSIRFYRNL